VPAADIRRIDPGMLARMLKSYEALHASYLTTSIRSPTSLRAIYPTCTWTRKV
jgi:hypothetical protein